MIRRFPEALRNVTCNVVTCACLTVLPQNILLTCPWYDLAAVGGTMQGGSQVPEELSVSHSHCTQTAVLPTHTNSLKTKAVCTLGFICFRWRRERTPLLEQRWLLTQLENGLASQGHTPTHLKRFCLFLNCHKPSFFLSPSTRCRLETAEVCVWELRKLLPVLGLYNKAYWSMVATPNIICEYHLRWSDATRRARS